MSPQPNPAPARPAVGLPRLDTCSHQSTCVDRAVRENWPGWSCHECAIYIGVHGAPVAPPPAASPEKPHPKLSKGNPTIDRRMQDVLDALDTVNPAERSEIALRLNFPNPSVSGCLTRLARIGRVAKAGGGGWVRVEQEATVSESRESVGQLVMTRQELAAELGCSMAAIFRHCKKLGFNYSERSPEQHNRLVASLVARKDAARACKKKPARADGEAPAFADDPTRPIPVPAVPSGLGSVLALVDERLAALEGDKALIEARKQELQIIKLRMQRLCHA